MTIMELGEHLDALFQCQLLKIAAPMAAWVTAWQKQVRYRHAWSFKPKNLSKYLQVFLLYSTPLMPPYIVKMTWSRPKMPCPHRISYFHNTVGEKMPYRTKTFCYDIFSKNFEHLQLS
jgi:hypothetical protein